MNVKLMRSRIKYDCNLNLVDFMQQALTKSFAFCAHLYIFLASVVFCTSVVIQNSIHLSFFLSFVVFVLMYPKTHDFYQF